jgi:hypothetical protein
MNYPEIYHRIVERAKSRSPNEDLYEQHHIIPKCLGGNDEGENIVSLTPEEHYVCHQLLVKIYPDNRNILFAANMMCTANGGQKRNNKLYGWLRKKLFKRVYLKCERCEKSFNVTESRHKKEKTKFCSTSCYRASVQSSTEYHTSNCAICRKTFIIPASHNKIKTQQCCSKECGIKLKQKNGRMDIQCKMCGKTKNIEKNRYKGPSKDHFCDQKCFRYYKKETAYLTYNCICCGREKTVLKSWYKNGKYLFCSIDCHKKYRKTHNIPKCDPINLPRHDGLRG